MPVMIRNVGCVHYTAVFKIACSLYIFQGFIALYIEGFLNVSP